MTDFDPTPHLKTIKDAIRRNSFGPVAMTARAALLAYGWTDDTIFDHLTKKQKGKKS